MTGTVTARRWAALLLAVAAAVLHLAVGYFYLTSGLVVPLPALFALWVVWGVLAAWLVRLAGRGSFWTPVVPVLAAAVLAGALVVGDAFLGWTA